jgi:predicted P-type ATPase
MSLSLKEREGRWSPDGPCSIQPHTNYGDYCGEINNSFIETRKDVPLRPWFQWNYESGDTFSEPAFYYVGIQIVAFALCCIWFCYTKVHKKQNAKLAFVNPRQLETPLLDTDQQQVQEEEADGSTLKMVGYKKHVLGAAASNGLTAWSALLMIAYSINVYGQYFDCQFIWPDAMCSLGDFRIMGNYGNTLSAHVYVCWSVLILYGFIIGMRKNGSNTFNDECPLDSAEFVFVEKVESKIENKSTSTNEEPIWFLKPLLQFYNMLSQSKKSGLITHFENCEVRYNSDHQKYINFQCERYIWNGSRFTLGRYHVTKDDVEAFRAKGSCLLNDEINDRENLVGKNLIAYEVEGYFSALVDEFMSFRYLYQLYMYMTWIYGLYWHVGGVLGAIVVVSALIRVSIKRKAKLKIYSMTRLISRTTVLRNGNSGSDRKWTEIPSMDLVPGDIVKLTSEANENWDIPADMILIQGNVICNESGLTGEPMPVNKKSLPQTTKGSDMEVRANTIMKDKTRRQSRADSIRRESFVIEYLCPMVDDNGDGEVKRKIRRSSLASIDLEETVKDDHFLFAGCKILEVGKVSKETLGGGWTKKAHGDKKEAGVSLAMVSRTGISTVRGRLIQDILYPKPMTFQWDDDLGPVGIILLFMGLVTGITGIYFTMLSGSAITSVLNLYQIFLWTASQLFSPAIPLALVVGQISSAKRLIENCNIDVKDPNRIALGGKVKTVCFDKTGTITKDYLDYIGFVNTAYELENEKNLQREARKLSPDILKGLATCHNLAVFGAGVIGPQVEVEMFKATGYELKMLDNVTYAEEEQHKIRTLEIFKFDHHTMTMSVVVEDLTSKKKTVYVKGAPEKLLKLCSPKTVPKHTQYQITKYALQGNYVLALATKPFKDSNKVDLDRKCIEQNLKFLGLILFRNEMKPDSPEVFKRLQDGGIECIMITGDNAMCGSYIAKGCGICDSKKELFLGDVDAISGDVVWAPLLKNVPSKARYNTDQILQILLSDSSFQLALTGNAYKLLQNEERYIRLLIDNVLIYARMSPDQKQSLVELIMDTGRVVCMVGDGGNDCGALRAAHVGLALTGSDASIVAPFTTTGKSLKAAVNLLLEGRCALANSFASYKFLVIYGQLFCIVKLLSYYYGAFMCNMGYLLIDIVFVIGVTTLMTFAMPKNNFALTTPTASLLSYETVWSVIQFHVVSLIVSLLGLLMFICDRGYIQHPSKYTVVWKYWTKTDSYEGGYFFIFFCMRIYGAAIAYSVGGKFRASIAKNRYLLLFVFTNFVFLSFLIFSPVNLVTKWFHMPSENFNREYTDRLTWIKYQEGYVRSDGEVLPRHEPSVEGITLTTRICVYVLMVASNIFSVWLENRESIQRCGDRQKY